MTRLAGRAACVLLLCTLAARGQQGLEQGKIKKVDAGRSLITITVGGKDRAYTVTPATLFAAGAAPVRLDVKDTRLHAGAPVQFKAVHKDGQDVLIGLRLLDVLAEPFVRPDTSGLTPLTELGTGRYKGFRGGLYPGGKNERPAAHEAAGLALARTVRPLDARGRPSPDGKVVLLSVGMSNTTQVFSTFQKLAADDPDRNPGLVLVDGAQGGASADRISDVAGKRASAHYWREVDRRLAAAGVTAAQVQAAWIKEADPFPKKQFPEHARILQGELARIVQVLHDRFPNLKLVYLSSRTYGGYARGPLNPDPFAYESGFAVRWLIGRQLKGDPDLNYDPAAGPVRAPWLSWGPYLWANGTAKRADGLFYLESDFGNDGTHPSEAGRQKVARLLLRFFKTDPTTRPWFVAR
jgi:hypothetical protein